MVEQRQGRGLSGWVRRLVDEGESAPGRAFDWVIQCFIVLSIVTFSLETLPGLSPLQRQVFWVIEVITVIIFTVELAGRLAFGPRGWRYLFTFYGIVDLLAILPFYLAMGVDLRGIRAFRLLRVLRLLKLARYNRALERYRQAFASSKDDLIVFGGLALLTMFVASVGIYYFEAEAQPEVFASIPDCLWWALATLTTVGYGDIYPITAGGRVFTFLILGVGLAVVAVPTGILAAALTNMGHMKEAEGREVEGEGGED